MPEYFDKLHGSIEHVRIASCVSKVRSYANLQECEAAISHLHRKFGDGEDGLHGYYCVFCNNFHIGRPPTASTMELLQVEYLIGFDFSRCVRHSRTVNRAMSKPEAFDAE